MRRRRYRLTHLTTLGAMECSQHVDGTIVVLCDASPVPLVWVTGSSGAGKSTVCALLKSRGALVADADWDGYNHWVDRTSGQVVADPPDPVPAGWLDRFAWRISRADVEVLAARAHGKTAFLCGTVENEPDVRDLFDAVVCLVVDNETLRHRLLTRTTNAFGKHPEELAAALEHNDRAESAYRRLGATIIDGTRPPAEVADAILAAVGRIASTPDPN
ncbi:AAA family ATPase [Amycolatopsis sp. NPDC059021]|uniref:AAA family ATPase n=1 Tax=Amycolatopsis sp. NPDC059021 TaxID=3346704 RepID=UPI00366FFB34